MALRALMLKKKIDAAEAELEQLRASDSEFEQREKQLEESIEEAETEEEKSTVEDEIGKFEEEAEAHRSKISGIEKDIEGWKKELADLEKAGERKKEDRGMGAKVVTPGAERELPRSSMEYRTAFRDYVVKGVTNDILEFEKREDQVTTSSDLGVLLPVTVMNEIIEEIGKLHGQLYGRVRKSNLKGGVKYPIGAFSATFKRVTENSVSDRQKVGSATGSVEFSYKIGEIRLAKTLLEELLEVPAFEKKFAECVAEAYVEAMDIEIITGSEDNEMVGILTEATKESGSRIKATHIIDFTAEDMADWTSWQKKLFAKIPLKMRKAKPEFVMTANTYEANIKTLRDKNDRPVYAETYNPVDGDEKATFKARPVIFVEDDTFKNFDDAQTGEFFGMYWVPEKAYVINENMRFTVVDYFDHETNQRVKKALVVNDGKPLHTDYIFLLRKGAATEAAGSNEGSGDESDPVVPEG